MHHPYNCVLEPPLVTHVEGITYNVTWTGPERPNAVVLKYELDIHHENEEEKVPLCHNAGDALHRLFKARTVGVTYTVRVKAISPAGKIF